MTKIFFSSSCLSRCGLHSGPYHTVLLKLKKILTVCCSVFLLANKKI